MADTNYKGLLQIHCQKAKVELPHYSCTQRIQGYSPVFLANLTVLGRNFASKAEFSSKKQAEKNVAKVALRELGLLGTDIKPITLQEGHHEQSTLAANDRSDGPVVSTSVADESQEGTHSTPISSVEICTTGSVQDPHISAAEVVGIASSPITQTPVTTASNISLSFKNALQERAQKMGLALPGYETIREGSGFVCTVTFNGQHFKSEGFSSNKKLAQQSAASVAIKLLNSEQGMEGKSPTIKSDAPLEMKGPVATPEKFDAKVSYKNLFQENCQQRGSKPPAYSTSWDGNLFTYILNM